MFYPLIGRLIQLCFLVQGVSKSSTPFKGGGKTPLPALTLKRGVCFLCNQLQSADGGITEL